MTTLLEKIQAEIDRAAEKCVDRDSLEIRDADREARAFKFGARFLLPLLKKAIERRNDYIRQTVEHKYGQSRPITCEAFEELWDDELLKLIGCEYE